MNSNAEERAHAGIDLHLTGTLQYPIDSRKLFPHIQFTRHNFYWTRDNLRVKSPIGEQTGCLLFIMHIPLDTNDSHISKESLTPQLAPNGFNNIHNVHKIKRFRHG